MGENPEMIDFFRLIIDEHFINKIVEETNRYTHDFFQSEQGQQLKPHSWFKLWDDVKRGDMMRFVGMIIGMGLVQQQDLHDYWSKDELLETPFFHKAMPRNTFLLMFSFLISTITTITFLEDRLDMTLYLRLDHFMNIFVLNFKMSITQEKTLP